jgi:hypothetical protein
MGRTYAHRREIDDQDRQPKNKQRKHSRNAVGEGMRVINNWSDDDYLMYEDSDEYYENTSQNNVNKRK